MLPDSRSIDTIGFDSFGTLVNAIDPMTEALNPVSDEPAAVASLWRKRAVFYCLICDDLDAYEPYLKMHRYGLRYALDRYGIEATDEEVRDLNDILLDLPPFDDVTALADLAAAGYNLYIVSNGNQPMLDGLIDATSVGPHLQDTVSADDVELYKPAPELYEAALERAQTPPERMLMVSAGVLDTQGAQHVGMEGCWINREKHDFISQEEPFGPDPNWRIDSLHELVAKFG